jgi:arginyl-tRNA synthetase
MKKIIEKLIIEAIRYDYPDFVVHTPLTIEHPKNDNFGDYSFTGVMKVFSDIRKRIDLNEFEGTVHSNPVDFAKHLVSIIEDKLPKEIKNVEVAGPGFINFYLSHEFFASSVKEILKQKEQWGTNNILSGKKVMVEYTQPNPFKPFHIGHLMSNAIGESISRIVEFSGAETIRANYQGDVGPHVAKAIWAIINSGENYEGKDALWIGEQYAKGSDAYDNDPLKKEEIDAINKKIYEKTDEKINSIYDWGRKTTLDAFEELYTLLGTKFNYYFFESEMAPIGEKIVRENLGKVFEESDGAIVFHGEKYDPKLHTRVFINSKGLPTYETKEIGLTVTKFEKENPDLSIITTAIEQGEYMKIVAKAISLIHPDYEKRMKHITHGMMRLSTGKMSSRKGNVITGESLVNDSMDIVREKVAERELSETEKDEISKIVGVAALKYSILRSSLGSDIVYDFEKSISFEGDSGPYLQYTAVRANSIIKKAEPLGLCAGFRDVPSEISTLEHLLYQFPEVVSHSYELLEPHHITTYLTELASSFNSFYANTVIVNKEDPYAPYRVALVEAFYQTMKNGLYLLGIKTPEKM